MEGYDGVAVNKKRDDERRGIKDERCSVSKVTNWVEPVAALQSLPLLTDRNQIILRLFGKGTPASPSDTFSHTDEYQGWAKAFKPLCCCYFLGIVRPRKQHSTKPARS